MLASVVLGHSEVVFVDYVGSVVVDNEVDSEVVYVGDSKARVLVVISLKTYTQTTLALTNSRPVGYEWMVIRALLPALLLSMVAEVTGLLGMTQSPASRSWFETYAPHAIPLCSRLLVILVTVVNCQRRSCRALRNHRPGRTCRDSVRGHSLQGNGCRSVFQYPRGRNRNW